MSEAKRHLPVLTNSSITTFRRCPREYYFNYVLLRKSRKKSAALTFGSMWHAGLEGWWAPIIANQEPSITRYRVAVEMMHRFASENGVDEFELIKAECLMAGYTPRWGDEPYETIAVEKNFAVPIVIAGSRAPSFDLRGSIDALVQTSVSAKKPFEGGSDGLASHSAGGGPTEPAPILHNVESKTTSADISAGSDYWRRVIALDSQVSTYNAASKAMGYDVHDTIYDVVRKPELVPLKATPEESKKYTKPTKLEPIPRLYANQRENDETPEEYRERLTADIIARPDWYFARQTIVRLEHDDEEHTRDVAQTATMIRFAEDQNAWPRSPNACERYRRICDYFEVCEGSTTIEDGTRFETKTTQHEELSE